MSNMKGIISLVIVMFLVKTSSNSCSRSLSRIVKHEIETKFLPIFKDMNVAIPDSCPLNPNRDIYSVQEENVMEESSSRYKCDFCGKAFISRFYMDLHLDNRHPDFVRNDKDVVCFADMCDIARCDIVSGRRKADFWEVSLCLEDDMRELYDKCENVINQCLPSEVTAKESKQIYSRLHGLCDFLTCKSYWEGPPDKGPNHVVMFSVMTVFIGIVMVIYYCTAYHYFYTDTFSDSYDYERPKQTFPGIPSESKRPRARQRFRYIQGELVDDFEGDNNTYEDEDDDDDR